VYTTWSCVQCTWWRGWTRASPSSAVHRGIISCTPCRYDDELVQHPYLSELKRRQARQDDDDCRAAAAAAAVAAGLAAFYDQLRVTPSHSPNVGQLPPPDTFCPPWKPPSRTSARVPTLYCNLPLNTPKTLTLTVTLSFYSQFYTVSQETRHYTPVRNFAKC